MSAFNRLSHAAFLAALVTVAGAAPAADLPSKSVYFGVSLGGHLVLDDWDLNDVADQPSNDGKSGFYGELRLGAMFAPYFGMEAQVGFVPYGTEASDTNFALRGSLDMLIHFMKGKWVPFLDIGGGFYKNLSGDRGKDIDYELHYGFGVRGMVLDWMALRIEARHVLTDGYDKTDSNPGVANNLLLAIGLDFFAWREQHGPLDSDKDGIPDDQDKCPTVWGHASGKGCPDRDGDGIVDATDRCPDVKGLLALQGCPDTDGDGIADDNDKCPTVPGVAARQGCPEPKDTDKDGVIDDLDECINEPGPADNKGCPKKTVVTEEIKKKFSGALQGIEFDTGKSTIRQNSYGILDKAAALMAEFADLKVAIEGHTDDQGKRAMNMKLSQARAESVATYLIGKGVAKARIVAIEGFGPDKPVEKAKTAKARAKNRRIEFRIVP